MQKKIVTVFLAGWICALSLLAGAADAPSVSADPLLERRVMAVAEELRCLVCQNQTIADSHAELAVDLRNQVREMLQKGMSEREIKDYMVQRYGDFVLYRPPVKSSTWLLWLGPFVLLLGALGFMVFKLRQRNRSLVVMNDGMSPEAQRRAELLLAGGAETSPAAAEKSSTVKDKA